MTNAYTIRNYLQAVNDVTDNNHPFSAKYTYQLDGNIDISEFNNQASSSNRRYRYAYSYDNLKRLISADFAFHDGADYVDARKLRCE